MSFTEDELQAFNSILEQRLTAHRQEIEQSIERRLDHFQHTIAHQIAALKQEMTGSMEQWSMGTREQSEVAGTQQINEQHTQLAHLLNQGAEQKVQQIEATIDRMLAAQLLGIEQLLSQHTSKLRSEVVPAEPDPQHEREELLTELSQALDERLVPLNDLLQHTTKDLEHQLVVHLRSLRDELTHHWGNRQTTSSEASLQEVLAGVEHLERVMESMQVAMTANHALLSNRLYHHQQLPLERAHPHPGSQTRIAPANGVGSLLTQAKEQLSRGQEPEIPARSGENESTGHQRPL